jgi:MSHA biogenesis protein MshP
MKKLQRGFSIITAIFLLVVLAGLGAAMLTFSNIQHQSSAMDVLGSRAYQAARAGIEWAAYGVSKTNSGVEWTDCAAKTPAASFPADGVLGGTLSAFTVNVYCSRLVASEVGASPSGNIWIYTVTASAVTGGSAGDPNYIERVISTKMGR